MRNNMDRFEWIDNEREDDEIAVTKQSGVKLYDGPDKTSFEFGLLILTTHRLIWEDAQSARKIFLPLKLIVYIEEEAARFHSPKIVVHVVPVQQKSPNSCCPSSSPHSYVRLSFKESGEVLFYQYLKETLGKRMWERRTQTTQPPARPRQVRAGIVGIERNLQAKQKATDKTISQAFEDLSQLIELAKPMVELSKSIANKIRDKQGAVTDDETVKYKSYLLSLGISNPVTRDTHGSGTAYHMELARQLADVLRAPVTSQGGIMALTDAFCIVNRARGMELLSPQDMVTACKYMDNMKLDVRLRKFNTGVLVVQLDDQNEDKQLEATVDMLTKRGCLSADELAAILEISVLLAKERLLVAELKGKACRDDTIEGLRFFSNLFLAID